MSVSEIDFYHPQAGWLLLLLVPLIYGQIALERYRKRQKERYAAAGPLSQLLFPRSFRETQLKNFGWLLIWAGGCLALMAPFGNTHYRSSLKPFSPHLPLQEVIFLVDISASMGVPDGYQGKSRLEQAQEIMENLVRQLEGQLGTLDTFTSALTPVVPPTLDYLFLRLAIKDLAIHTGEKGGTDFESVLKAVGQKMLSRSSGKQYTLLLFSDGGDNEWEKQEGKSKEKREEKILNSLPNSEQTDFHLFSIGLGTLRAQPIPHVTFEGQPVSSALEPDLLRALAKKGHGHYYQAEEWNAWNLAQELMKQLTQTSLNLIKEENEHKSIDPIKSENRVTDLYYQIPLGIVLILYLINLYPYLIGNRIK